MYRINPTGRVPRTSKRPDPIRVGEGERIHQRSPVHGLPLCMPSRAASAESRDKPGKGNTKQENIQSARGQQITCMRCTRLMVLNQQLRADDLAVGDSEPLLGLARSARRT